jgi:hypothetical protein
VAIPDRDGLGADDRIPTTASASAVEAETAELDEFRARRPRVGRRSLTSDKAVVIGPCASALPCRPRRERGAMPATRSPSDESSGPGYSPDDVRGVHDPRPGRADASLLRGDGAVSPAQTCKQGVSGSSPLSGSGEYPVKAELSRGSAVLRRHVSRSDGSVLEALAERSCSACVARTPANCSQS